MKHQKSESRGLKRALIRNRALGLYALRFSLGAYVPSLSKRMVRSHCLTLRALLANQKALWVIGPMAADNLPWRRFFGAWNYCRRIGASRSWMNAEFLGSTRAWKIPNSRMMPPSSAN